jgi:hypothetical protein
MTLRISDYRADGSTVVRIEGRLEREGVADLEAVCSAACGALQLDLGALLNVDDEGLDLLRTLIASGATVTRVSPYIRLLIESGAAGRSS